MKKLYDDDENEFRDIDKAKILVTVIPFVLIIIILAITLLVNSCNHNKKGQDNDQLQESIKDYADDKLPKDEDASAVATPLNEVKAEPAEPTPTPTATPQPEPTPYKEVMEAEKDYSKIAYEIEPQLKEMMTYWADNHQQALDDLANLDHFKAMSWSLKGTENYYYYGDINGSGQPHGTGIAVYADNQYYYGEWVNGLRSGKGTWIHYHIHEKENKTDLYKYHQYTGGWKNDLPDGEGSEHYDYNMELLKEREGYNTNLIGSYKEGLIHGEFYLTNIYDDGNVKEWNAQADMGTWIKRHEQADPKGNYPVYVDVYDDDNYIWMNPRVNKNIGVPCMITPNKN